MQQITQLKSSLKNNQSLKETDFKEKFLEISK